MRKSKKSILFLVGIAIIGIASCTKTDTITYDCTGLSPTYTTDIKPILDSKCATSGCHDATTKANGINLSNYADSKSESSRTRFMGSMQHSSGYKPMPENQAKLSDASLQKIYCWIQNGAPQ